MKAIDSVALSDVKISDAGFLEANARTARAGVQRYRGFEVGRDDLEHVDILRDEGEVFAKPSLESFSKIPLCLDHPPEAVTSANWRKYAVGTTGDEVLRDGQFLKIGLKITDADAIDAVQVGKRELSVGYSADVVWGDGIAPDGTPYQARQTQIVANHIAIVSAGRAGRQCRIGDSWADISNPEPKGLPAMTLKSVTVDGIPIETTDQGATVIATLQQRLADSANALASEKAAHVATLAARDKELGTKDAEINRLKAETLDATKLDQIVAERSDVIGKAKLIAKDLDCAGKSIADIRRAAVIKKLGDALVKDRSDDYCEALFDGLAASTKPDDPLRDALRSGLQPAMDVTDADTRREAARLQMIADQRIAWKTPVAANGGAR